MADIFLLVLFISLVSIILLTPLAEKVGLVDMPNDWRKRHQGTPALIGGVSVYMGLLVGISQFITPTNNSLTYLLCSTILVILGVADDKWDLSASKRLVVQAGVAAIMCWGSGLSIHTLGNILGLGVVELPEVLSYGITVIAVIAAINAFNMIDGIDGLLGISSLVTFVGMGYLFWLNHDTVNMKLALIISAALLPYLFINLGVPALPIKKIFMGDTGSMLIGFTAVWLLLQGTQINGEVTGKPAFSAALALWLIAFPLMDMVRVMGYRLWQHRSLAAMLTADRSHLHHILQDVNGDSKHTALLKICALSGLFAITGIMMQLNGANEVMIFLTFLASFAVYTSRIRKLTKKSQ